MLAEADQRADMLRSSILQEKRRCRRPANRQSRHPSGSGSLPVVLMDEPTEEIAALDLAQLGAENP